MCVAGIGFVGVGLWARREARRALAREHIVRGDGDEPMRGAAAARSMAELIRKNTLEATGGRTYAEVAPYVTRDGEPTSDAGQAVTDERTGQPLESADHYLWIQSMTLQTALTQAYLAFRLADLTLALGTSLALLGAGHAAAARRLPASPSTPAGRSPATRPVTG